MKKLSAYNLFFQEKVKLKNDDGHGMSMRQIADMWKEASADDKSIYQERAQKHNDDLDEQIKNRKLDDLIRRKKPSAKVAAKPRRREDVIPESDESEVEQERPARRQKSQSLPDRPSRKNRLEQEEEEQEEEEQEVEQRPVKSSKHKASR